MHKMRLGIQGWFLTKPHTGIGRHTAGLISELSKHCELFVLVPKALPKKQRHELGLKENQVKVLRPRAWLPHPALKKWAWESEQVPAAFAKQKLDWEYYPYPCPLPEKSPHKRAMTVHDLILWEDTRYQGKQLKKNYYQKAKRALIHVDHLFTVSAATHDELGIPAATILPNAVTPVKPAKSKKGGSKDLVYFGGYDVRKRVPLLVQRFTELHKKDPDFRLLLVGEPQEKSKLYPEVPAHPAVRKLGNLSDAELFALLKNAYAFVHASDSEGFNLPLLEAMQAGTPALVTDLPVNREVSGGSTLFWDPSKKESLIAIMKSLSTSAKRKARIEKQKKVAKSYSWSRSAKCLLKALSSR